MPTARNDGAAHVDKHLTNISVNFKPTDFRMIADALLPRIPVEMLSDKYLIYNKADNFTVPRTYRGPRSKSNEVAFGSSDATYSCDEYGLRDFITDRENKNADAPMKKLEDAAESVTGLMLLDREIRAASVLGSTAILTQNTTLAGVNQWSDYANSDPFANIETAKAACFLPANTIMMAQNAFNKLKHHPDLLERVKYSERGVLTVDMLAALFEVDQVVIANAKYNSAADGLTASYGYVWSNDVIVAHVKSSPTLKSASLGYTVMATLEGGTDGFRARRYRDEARGGGGTWVDVDTAMDELVVAAECAYLIKAAV